MGIILFSILKHNICIILVSQLVCKTKNKPFIYTKPCIYIIDLDCCDVYYWCMPAIFHWKLRRYSYIIFLAYQGQRKQRLWLK